MTIAGVPLAQPAACIALAAAGFISVDHQVGDFQRVPVPGQAEITLSRPGGYVRYIEQPGHRCPVNVGGGTGQDAPFPAWAMRVPIQPAGGGAPVPVSAWRGAREFYDLAGHQGQRAMSGTAGKAGGIRCGPPTPRQTPSWISPPARTSAAARWHR